MNGRYIIDTNIIVGLFANEDAICTRFHSGTNIVLPSIVLGELYYGAFKSMKTGENLRKINRLVAEKIILSCDAGTAYEYGRLRNEQRMKGKPLPENDLWIAALAMQHNLIMASRDKHFADIDGLKWECWLKTS
jgi:tRNA(fMet)-specific endonuclease VapC